MTLSAIPVLMSAFMGEDFWSVKAMPKLTCKQNTYSMPRHRGQGMKAELTSGLEKEHRAGDRGLGAEPSLQPVIFETLEKLPTQGFIYSTLKWAHSLPTPAFYVPDFSSTLSTTQCGIVVVISRAFVHLYGMGLLPQQHNEFSHKLHVQRTV